MEAELPDMFVKSKISQQYENQRFSDMFTESKIL